LGASLWVGGLLALLIGLLPLVFQNQQQVSALLRAGWEPFGRLAAFSVGLIIVTGLYSAGRQVASVDALLVTGYGRTLLGKTGLFLAVGFIGAVNATLLHPRLAAGIGRILRRPPGWKVVSFSQLPRLMIVEGTLGAGLVLLTGLLTASPTAQGQEFQPVEKFPSTLSQTVDDLFITLTVKPNQPGQNVISVRAVSQRKPAPAEILRVILRLGFQEQDLGVVSVDTEQVEPGYYLIGGSQLNLAGPWQIDVVVRRDGLEDGVAHFDWTVASKDVRRPVLLSNYPWQPVLTFMAAFLILIFLSIIIVSWRLDSTSRIL
jgi:copper transport protein